MCGRYATTMGQTNLYGLFSAEPDPLERAAGPGAPADTPGVDGPPPGRGGPAAEPDQPMLPGVAQTSAPAVPRDRGQLPAGERAPADLAAGRYNIAPTSTVPVVLERRGDDDDIHRYLRGMRWGLVPSWAKELSVGNRMFNARADSVATKPAFRTALHKRRCLLPASGYFEWRTSTGPDGRPDKQPFYITPEDGSTLAFAGLWEFWRPPSGEPVVSCTILTTDPVGELAAIHDRMPLILPAADWDAWLDPTLDGRAVAALLSPPEAALIAQLELRPVSKRVGNVRNDDPQLLEPVRGTDLR